MNYTATRYITPADFSPRIAILKEGQEEPLMDISVSHLADSLRALALYSENTQEMRDDTLRQAYPELSDEDFAGCRTLLEPFIQSILKSI